ncbi:MAG: RNA methyltransferase [Rhodobacteraceae bacterium]|nr:RNA methyltransferase [Paracoccaceae bacterium]
MISEPNSNFEAHPDFVFVNPQLGENIGSAARGMLNFGITKMVLVSPREGWLSSQAIARASGASSLLDEARIYQDVESAVQNYSYVFATTARRRGLVKEVVTPEVAMNKAMQLMAEGNKVAFLFGPERTGLENKDITLANDYVFIPTNPEFSSLNLAHSVVLLAYEWRQQKYKSPQPSPEDKEYLASVASKMVLANYFIRDLEGTGYFDPENRIDSMKEYLRNLILRMDMTEGEVKTFHRIRKALSGKE